MSKEDFSQPVAVDSAPRGSVCEWCGKLAEEQLTAIGGVYHNRGGLFCHDCGEAFTLAVVHALEKKEGDARQCHRTYAGQDETSTPHCARF